MPNPMHRSVTDVPCCGCLERQANDPDTAIVFDEALNEFNFEYHKNGRERRLRLYHCPFCGGAAPQSKRGLLFAVVTWAEAERLRDLVKEVHTLDEAIALLGPPDVDQESGMGVKIPESRDRPSTRECFRAVIYTQLSETGNLRLTDYPGRRIGVSVQGKYIGERS